MKLDTLRERLLMMAGSDANYLSKELGKLAFGKTAYAGETTIYGGLWTAALDDTLLGNTANEAAYTSYARLSLTNNTTIFAVGSGTTTYTKTWPSDAAKSWPGFPTGGSATITYMGALNGNCGHPADKGMVWARSPDRRSPRATRRSWPRTPSRRRGTDGAPAAYELLMERLERARSAEEAERIQVVLGNLERGWSLSRETVESLLGGGLPKNSMQSWRETLYATIADGTAVTAAAKTILVPDFTLPAN